MNIPISKCSKEFKKLVSNLLKADILFDIEYLQDDNFKTISLVFSRKLQGKEEYLKTKFKTSLKDEYYEYSYNNDCEYKVVNTDTKAIKQWMECEDFFTLKKIKNMQ